MNKGGKFSSRIFNLKTAVTGGYVITFLVYYIIKLLYGLGYCIMTMFFLFHKMFQAKNELTFKLSTSWHLLKTSSQENILKIIWVNRKWIQHINTLLHNVSIHFNVFRNIWSLIKDLTKKLKITKLFEL